MKKIIHLWGIMIVMILFIGCNQRANSKKNNNTPHKPANVDTLSYETPESSGGLSTISNLDFWLRAGDTKTVSGVTDRLLDAYNSAAVMNSLITDFDLQFRFESERENTIKAIKNIVFAPIKDNGTIEKLCSYRQEILHTITPETDTTPQDIDYIWETTRNLYIHLTEKYHVSTFGNLDADLYRQKYLDCPSVPQWSALIEKRGNKNMVEELEKEYEDAQTYDSRCIYAMELAHAYEADQDSWADDATRNPAMSKMEALMNEQQYSIYLLELWRKWRVLYQNAKGASKDSEIPNNIYNEYRKLCAKTILSHIGKHPEDLTAINVFLVLSFEHNILREGLCSVGNQSIIDEYRLFYEKFRE